jgi:hypothetical protein
MPIVHKKTATFPDQPDVEINAGEWNDEHTIPDISEIGGFDALATKASPIGTDNLVILDSEDGDSLKKVDLNHLFPPADATLSYNVDGDVDLVTLDNGKSFELSYSGGNLTEVVANLIGITRTFTLGYSGGNLTTVTNVEV